MASRRQYPQAELWIPTVPNFPLSSPITEEVASPTSSSSDERDMERRRPFEFLSKVTSRNPFLQKVNCTQHAAGESDRICSQCDYGKGNASLETAVTKKNTERPVGLNLVTDFSSNSNAHEKASEPSLVDLEDLKILSKEREKERSTQKLKGILKKSNKEGSHCLPDDSSNSTMGRPAWFDIKPRISPKKKFKDDLSPSDRPIMIGLITPAKEDTFWNRIAPEHQRPRAASSIYSQPTPCLENRETPIPPVPAIPAHHTAEKNEIISPRSPRRQSLASTRKHRSFSAGTVFEEDEISRPGTRSRSYSSSSVKKAFGRLSGFDGISRLSINSELNRHQSQGWWNYLLSPLLNRSSTISSKKPPKDVDRPPVPALKTNLSESSEEWWEKEVSCFSPETPETTVANRRDMASWQNCEKDPFADFNSITDPHAEPSVELGYSTSFMFPGRAIQGSAAEYFQACAHELFSRRPYFECINHVCSITPQDQIPVSDIADAAPSGNVGERGLLVDVDDMPRSENQVPRSTPIRSSVSNGCSCGGSAVAEGSEASNHSPEVNNSPKESTSNTPGTGSPEPQTKRVIPKIVNDNHIPIVNSPEPSKLDSPASEPSPRRGIKGAETADVSERQPYNPFIQQTTAAPPVTHVYVQTAPGPSPAPIVSTERAITQYIVVPPSHGGHGVQPQPSDPPSPDLQQTMEGIGSIPLSVMPNGPEPAHTRSPPAELPPRIEPQPITRHAMTNPFAERERIETRRRRLEREDAIGKKAGGLWRGRGCISNKGCFGRPGREGRLKRRWYMAITAFFLTIVIVAVVLALVLTRKGDEMPVQSQWLNLTGYPPMPTGIATVAGPEAKVQNSGCITPPSLWSCTLPKEQQDTNKGYSANQPNFRVEIRFRNGTYPNSTTVASDSHKSAVSKRYEGRFDPSPSPPDVKDLAFLGNTTDNNTNPFAGEETPFYMTFLSPVPLFSVRRVRRSDNPFPDIDSLIPSPAVNPDGTAAAANLYPLPKSQPVRLYNRGKDSEYYGFYTYFDRSIFLASTSALNGSKADDTPDDANGGSSKDQARVRCTWAQTRFLVQIWTQSERSGKNLLDSKTSSTSSSASATPTPTSTDTDTARSSNSSAMDFTRPGSFPYPITITLDRHGGDAKKKMVYCYGLEPDQHINSTDKKLQVENRGFGGKVVNPAPGLFNITGSSSDADSDLGFFDGGTGGCSCQWTNWINKS
ncbi:hypothetical protein EYZ11_007328 [Aspergillus tanneri]|uniref:Glycoprotease family protein n=1 Tax=Aspergillus tanneri TaxID=1220188 RepID=A0A4S3JIX3_9EURO|nr:hypothetical protein EYZ11_007328 [Aspergillus tanneri]